MLQVKHCFFSLVFVLGLAVSATPVLAETLGGDNCDFPETETVVKGDKPSSAAPALPLSSSAEDVLGGDNCDVPEELMHRQSVAVLSGQS